MKKVSTIIMALAVIMGMTQCTKPAMPLYDGTYTGVTKEITFSTGGSSKVEIENVLNELKFKWQTGDTLYVYGSKTGTFSDGQYCGKLGIVRGMGTENGFFSGTLENVPETGMLRFYYCPNVLFDKEHKTITVDLSDQDGSLEDVASHLVACADVAVKPDGGDYSATLAVPYAVVKFDLSAFGTTAVTMTGTTNKGLTISANGVKDVTKGESTTLSGTAVSSATCYVSIMPENVTTLGFSGGGKVGEKAVNLESGNFYAVQNTGGSVPVPALLPGDLPGEFSVSAGEDGIAGTADDVKVHFSQGNLWYDATAPEGERWKLENNQWDYGVGEYFEGGYLPEDESITGPGYLINPNHLSHFCWSQYESEACGQNNGSTPAASSSDVLFTEIPGFTVEGQTGLRTLSCYEWNYLIGFDPDQEQQTSTYGRANAKNLCGWTTLTDVGVSGCVILPDNTENPSVVLGGITTTTALADAAAVFLPAAGSNGGGHLISNTNECVVYKTSTPNADCWSYHFVGWEDEMYVEMDVRIGFRFYRQCIRLVRDVE